MPSSEFRENAEDLNTRDSVQVNVNAIRRRLDAYTGPDHYRYTIDGIEYDAHWAHDTRRLMDENARLNAELAGFREMAVLNTKSLSRALDEARAELDRVIREGAADKALIAEFATLQDRIPDTDNGDWGLGYDQGYNAALNDVRSMAAPEMPRPPTEEAQERPETPGAGSGRGTGVAETQGTAQASGSWIPWLSGDECPHRPEWTCPDHAECRSCECGCNTYAADLEEPDLSLIPADMVVRDPEICSGRPTMRGTRILASTIALELAAGTSWEYLREMYPSLPAPGEEA